METPKTPVVPGNNQTPPPVQSSSPLHDKSMKWNILIGGGLLVVGLFSYFLAGGGLFKGQIKLVSNNLEQMSQANIDELGNCIDFNQSQTYEQATSNLTVQEIKLKKDGCKNDLFVAVAAGQQAVMFMHSSIKAEADKSGMTYDISYKTNVDDGLVTLDYGDGTVFKLDPTDPAVKVDEANKTFTIKHPYSKVGPYKITAKQEVDGMKDKEGKQLYLTATSDIVVANGSTVKMSSPAAATVLIGQTITLANMEISSEVDTSVKNISFNVEGINNIKELTKIGIYTTDSKYEGPILLATSIGANGKITFDFGEGVLKVNKASPAYLALKATIGGTSGNTYAVSIKDASAIQLFDDKITLAGSFPLNSNSYIVSSSFSVAKVVLSKTPGEQDIAITAGSSNIDVLKFNLEVSDKDTAISKVYADVTVGANAKLADITNVKLYVDGNPIGKPTIKDGKIVIDLSSDFYPLKDGTTTTLSLKANIATTALVGGTYTFNITKIEFIDADKLPTIVETGASAKKTVEGTEAAEFIGEKMYIDNKIDDGSKDNLVADFEINLDAKQDNATPPYIMAKFKDKSTPQDQIEQWDWDFQGGVPLTSTWSSPLKNPPLVSQSSYVYQDAPTSYPVKLKVTYKNGQIRTVTHNVDMPAKPAKAAEKVNPLFTISDTGAYELTIHDISDTTKGVEKAIFSCGKNDSISFVTDNAKANGQIQSIDIIKKNGFACKYDEKDGEKYTLSYTFYDKNNEELGKFINEKTTPFKAAEVDAGKLTANYMLQPQMGTQAGFKMKFLNTSNPGDKITSHKWNFDDNTASETSQDTEHVYKYPALTEPEATYKPSLTVSNGTAEDTFTSDVTIKHPVSFKISCVQRIGTFIVTCKLDPLEINYNDDVTNIEINYGDNSQETDMKVVDNSIGIIPEHTYDKEGKYSIKVTLTDDYSQALSKTLDFNVVPKDQPTDTQVSASAYLYADSFGEFGVGKGEGMPGETVKYGDGLMIISDKSQEVVKYALHFVTDMKEWAFDEPRKDNLPIGKEEKSTALKAACSVTPETGTTTTEFTFSGKDSTGKIVGGRWDFGDKSTPVSLNSSTEVENSITHKYAAAGPYTASLTIGDENKGINKCEKKIVVSAAEKAAEKPAEKPVEKPAATSGNTTINNYYNTTTNTTTTTTATPAPTQEISRFTVIPDIKAGTATKQQTTSKLTCLTDNSSSVSVFDDSSDPAALNLNKYLNKDYNEPVVRGYTEEGKNLFKPYQDVSNAEFTKMLSVLSCLKQSNKSGFFSDVKDADWFAKFVNAAVDKGLIVKSSDNFGPNDKVTRMQALVMLSKFADIKTASASCTKGDFADVSKSDKNATLIRNAACSDLVIGQPIGGKYYFRGNDNLNRSDAAAFLSNYIYVMTQK